MRRVGLDHRGPVRDLRRLAARSGRSSGYKVNIPAGVRDGSRVRVAGKGEAGMSGGEPGDLYVITRVSASPIFRQLGDRNLEVEVPITIAEALQGATVEVPTLNGSKKIRVAPGTRHGTLQRLRGEGAPKLEGRRGESGDIHYRFVIEVPKELNRAAAEGRRRAREGVRRQPA